MDFQDREFQSPITRRQRSIAVGQFYTRTYRVPMKAADSLIPARGDAISLRDVTGSGLLAPRVLNNPRKQNVGDLVEVTIDFVQVEAYVSGGTSVPLEIKSSRREWDSADYSFGERIFVAAAESDLPDTGEFFTNSAGTNESGLKLRGRKCVRRNVDDQSVPGLYLGTLTYLAFKPFQDGGSAADKVEIRPRTGPRLTGVNNWDGRRTWLCTYAAAKSLSATVWGENFPDMSGLYTPQALSTPRFEYDPEGWVDAVRVTVHYATPRVRIYTPTVGKASLTLGGSYIYRLPEGSIVRDLGDKIVKGPSKLNGKHVWVPKVAPGPYPIIRLDTAAEEVDIAETLQYVGTVNSQDHSYIFSANADQLLMLPLQVGHKHGENLAALSYFMAFNLDGWSNVVQSQLGYWAVVRRNVMNWNNSTQRWEYDPDEAGKAVFHFIPDQKLTWDDELEADVPSDSEPESRQMFVHKDWTGLSGLTTW